MMRALSLATIVAAAVALPAIAQDSKGIAPPAATAKPAPAMMLTAAEAQAWVGKPIYSSDEKKIGSIVAFARGSDNVVKEVHADIGGFLGLGETRVRLLPAQVMLRSDRVVLDLTAAQAKDLPTIQK